MNLKLEIALLVLGGVLRILCVGWNFYYYKTATFDNRNIEYCCLAFLVAPSLVFLLICFFSSISDCFKCEFHRIHFKVGLGLLIAIGGPIGAPLFVYAVLLATNDSHTGDFHIIESISRATSLIESIFESLPQIALQIYNNNEMQYWSEYQKIAPIVLSFLGCAYSAYKLCHSLDKVQHYENAITMKVKPDDEDKAITRKSVQISAAEAISKDNDFDVYDMNNEH